MFKRRHEPPIQELENMLEDCLALFSCVFVTIDALDESQDRFSLLLAIETLATGPRFSKIQLLATSRVYVDIERSLKPFAIAFSLDNELVEHDIRRYVRAAITKEHKLNLGRWPQPMLELVVDIVPKKAKGMYVFRRCY
jgi:hypothetical protein